MLTLAEYLLAYKHKNAGSLVRFGASWVELTMPALTTIAYTMMPISGTYAHIQFDYVASQKIVPDTIWVRTEQHGIQVNSGYANSVFTSRLAESWIIYTEADPLRVWVTNTSNVNQYVESIEAFLIVDSLEHFKIIQALINNYFEGGVYNVSPSS